MIRGTTPTLILEIDDESLDLSTASEVYVTIQQKGTVITKTTPFVSVDENVISCWLTQEESLRLKEYGQAYIQVNWTYYINGELRRDATEALSISIDKQLLGEVLP